MLERQRATLWLTFATLVATILLYIFIPKGFLPQQDTGTDHRDHRGRTGSLVRGNDASFSTRSPTPIRRDPDVTGVVSIAGVTTINPTPNAGRLTITLKPRNERRAFVTEIVDRLQASVAPIPGIASISSRSRTSRSAPASAARSFSTR